MTGSTSFLIREGEVEVSVHIPQQGSLPASVIDLPGHEAQSPRTPPAVSPARPLVPLSGHYAKVSGSVKDTAGSPIGTVSEVRGPAVQATGSAGSLASAKVSAAAAAHRAVSGAEQDALAGGSIPSTAAQPVNQQIFACPLKEVPVSDDLLIGKIQESCSRARLALSRKLVPSSNRCSFQRL